MFTASPINFCVLVSSFWVFRIGCVCDFAIKPVLVLSIFFRYTADHQFWNTGSEAMFADLCYFSVRSVQVCSRIYLFLVERVYNMLILYYRSVHFWDITLRLSFMSLKMFNLAYIVIDNRMLSNLQLTFMFLVLPCLLLGYLGQAAYLMENHADTTQAFFSSVPSKSLVP